MKNFIYLALALTLLSCSKEPTIVYKIGYVDSQSRSQDYIYNFEDNRTDADGNGYHVGCNCSYSPYVMSSNYQRFLPEDTDSSSVMALFYENYDSDRYKVYECYAIMYDKDWGTDKRIEDRCSLVVAMDVQYELGLIDEDGKYI